MAIMADPGVKDFLKDPETSLDLDDNAHFFLAKADKIGEPSYLPTDEDILKAVELVEFLDANKGPIKALSTFLYLGFVAFIAYGVTAKGNPEYGLPLIGQCILGEPGSLYYGDCPPL